MLQALSIQKQQAHKVYLESHKYVWELKIKLDETNTNL